MIPRHSYLSLLIDKVKSHYSEFSGFDTDQLWFSFNSIAMQWHVPAGVLYDLMSILDPNTIKLPWSLTANFGSFPADTVLRCSNEEDAQWNYLNNLKECMYIRFNSTSAMMTFSNEDQEELWSAVKNQNEPVFSKLLDKIKQGTKITSVDDMLYAIRIYSPLKKDSNSSVNLSDDSKKKDVLKYKKNMIRLKRDQAKQLDLESFLNNHVVPQLIKSGYFGDCEAKIDRVVIQGVEPPKETGMLWLVENCAHPDGFVYICCK